MMSFPELSGLAERLPKLEPLFQKLDSMLHELARGEARRAAQSDRRRSHVTELTPEMVSIRLQCDEGLALVLLAEVEQTGLLSHRYYAYCPHRGDILHVCATVAELPAEVTCELEGGIIHKITEYCVELAFQLIADPQQH